MSKRKDREEVIKFLSLSLTHRIGSMVNKNDLYAPKYKEESEQHFKKAQHIAWNLHWNAYDKAMVKDALRKKLEIELKKRDFLADEKFSLMEQEISASLKELNLD